MGRAGEEATSGVAFRDLDPSDGLFCSINSPPEEESSHYMLLQCDHLINVPADTGNVSGARAFSFYKDNVLARNI